MAQMIETQYITNRKKDSILSEYVGQFMDEYFYSRLDEEWRRNTDTVLQRRGVDVVFGDSNIDEKVKIRGGYLNTILAFPSFELSFVNRNLKRQTGWFLDTDSLTDYYAFIAVYSDAKDEYSVNYDNIDHLNVMFVNRIQVMKYVLASGINLGKDMKELATETMGDRINHPGTGIHIKMSMQFSEKPINMVVRREILYKLDKTREFDVHRNFIQDTNET